jgi:hypothetical protein
MRQRSPQNLPKAYSEFERQYREVDALAESTRLSDHLTISLQDSWAVLGVKGSGKTTFARALLPRMNEFYPAARNYILDSKGYGEFDDYAALPNAFLHVEQKAPLPLERPGSVQVWKPPLNDQSQYNIWFGNILRAQKPCIILVDEAASLTDKRGGEFPQNFVLLLKQGRIMDECVISMSQEFAAMERNIFGQATHFLRFFLINRYDLRESNSLLGFGERDRYRNPSKEHGFFYRRLDRPALPTFEYYGYQEFL